MTSLLDEVGPDLYRTNAFRVTGLPVGATTRDIRRQGERVRAAGKYGISAAGAGAPVLPLPRPPDEDAVREIAQRLRDPAKRLVDELFWFWPEGEGGTDDALDALRAGDLETAWRTWRARSTPIARHNLAIVPHARALDAETPDGPVWTEALARWRDVLGDDAFWELFERRAAELDDPRLTPATARGVRRGLPTALLSINAELAVRAWRAERPADAKIHLAALTGSGFDVETVEDVRHQAVRADRDRVEELCDAAKRDVDADIEAAGAAGATLLERTAAPLGALGFVLADDDPVLRGARDRVARQVMRCAVGYGNHTGDWRTSRELLAAAHDIAATESTGADIARNLTVAENNVRGDTCLFCAHPADEHCSVPRPVHGNVRHELGRVTWQTITVPVPRCRACKERHSRTTSLFVLGCFALPLGGGFALPMLGNGLVLLGVVAAIIAVAGLVLMVRNSPSGMTRKERTASFAYGPLRELLAEGWRLGSRPPGVQ